MNASLRLVLAAALSLSAASVLANDTIGVVKRSAGAVTVERSGAQLSATPGLEVQRGDRVVTGPDGYASISLRGTAPLSIGPDADVGLDRFVRNQRPVVERFVQPIIQGVASLMGGIARH